MGTRAKPKIKINKNALEKQMAKRGIQSYLMLAFMLTDTIEDISEPSVYRWNREGWPERKFMALCELLGCAKYKPGDNHSLGSPV